MTEVVIGALRVSVGLGLASVGVVQQFLDDNGGDGGGDRFDDGDENDSRQHGDGLLEVVRKEKALGIG